MNRPIKFRAWCKTMKRMLDGSEFTCSGDFKMIYNLPQSDCEIELMQFAGFTDKNDQEVYEGDFVKFYDDGAMDAKPIIAEVKFKDGEFYPKPSDCVFGVYEVIGNIYENPQLNTPA